MKNISRKPSELRKDSVVDEHVMWGAGKGLLESTLRNKARKWLEEMLNDELDVALGTVQRKRESKLDGHRGKPDEHAFIADVPQKVEISRARRPEVKQDYQHETWERRDLSAENIAIVFLSSSNLDVRVHRRASKRVLLSAIGISQDGTRVALGLDLCNRESASAWESFISDLHNRGIKQVTLAVINCSGVGPRDAVKNIWPWAEIQRCVLQELRDLYTYVPEWEHKELRQNYESIVYFTSDVPSAMSAWLEFEEKWKERYPEVVKHMEGAIDELLTFFKWPKRMWRQLRGTHYLMQLGKAFRHEFRQQAKARTSSKNMNGSLDPLCRLFVSEIAKARRMSGHEEMFQVVTGKRLEMGLIEALDKEQE